MGETIKLIPHKNLIVETLIIKMAEICLPEARRKRPKPSADHKYQLSVEVNACASPVSSGWCC